MTAQLDPHAALAALAWQVEMGADEAICDAPVNRFAQAPAKAAPKPPPTGAPAAVAPAPALDPGIDPVAEAEAAAHAARDLPALAAAVAAFPHCALRQGARNCVFADGSPGARVMIVGEAPGSEEDQRGLPFVGRAGQLLDRMLAAIGLHRHHPDPGCAAYITNVLPWRPPGNRRPTPEECAMMLPFLSRHVELAAPDILVLMGNTPTQTLLGPGGILRRRGIWVRALDRPTLPMVHPAYLLRNPAAKREAWADLLSLQARLRQSGVS